MYNILFDVKDHCSQYSSLQDVDQAVVDRTVIDSQNRMSVLFDIGYFKLHS